MTLLEMMLVVSIMVILMTFTTPLFTSISESSNLTTAGQILSDQIKLAAQIASSRNQVAEVRLIKLNQTSENTASFRAVQLWMPALSGSMSPVDKITLLPQGIVISESSNLSPLLTLPRIGKGTLSSGAAKNSTYVAFIVHPSGYFEPAPDDPDKSHLYITLLSSRYIAASSTPVNYVTVQISPYTCSTTIYRP